MDQSLIRKILLILGVLPFILPLIVGIYKISIESWKLLDWLIMYSFLYYPTYIIGVVLILIAVLMRKK